MRNPKYQFLLNGTEVFPIYKELKKKYALESGQYFFRVSLDGQIKLQGFDYIIVANTSLDDINTLSINKYNYSTNKFELYYEASFNKTDCKFDNDARSVELKLSSKDSYTKILDKYEHTFDLIKAAPAITPITYNKRAVIQTYIVGANRITNLSAGTYWTEDVNEVINDFGILERDYHFAITNNFIEIDIKAERDFKKYSGIYVGDNELNAILSSEHNSDYKLKITDKFFDTKFTYYFLELINASTGATELWALTTGIEGYISGAIASGVTINFYSDSSRDTLVFSTDLVFAQEIAQRILCDVDTVGDTPTYDVPYNDISANSSNYKKCIGLTGGMYAITDKAVTKPTSFGQNDYKEYFTNKFTPLSAGFNRFVPIDRNSWANASIWYTFDDSYYLVMEPKLRKQIILRDAYSIAEVIKVLLHEIDPNISHEATPEYSQFLYGSSNPVFGNKFTLFLTQKTNILKGNYDQPAQKAEITLKDVMDMLRDCFRCYWYVEDNKFKIEHVKWFMNGRSYSEFNGTKTDLQDLVNILAGKNYAFYTNKIEYDKSELAGRYEFEWGDNATELFSALPIDVLAGYVDKSKTENIAITNFATDIDFMLASPNSFSNDGFALLGAISDGDSYSIPIFNQTMIDEQGDTFTGSVQNGFLTWYNLMQFYMFDMPGKNITAGNNPNLFVQDIKKCMLQEVTFPAEIDPDLYMLISTDGLNFGTIRDMSINIDTRQVTTNLVYIPK